MSEGREPLRAVRQSDGGWEDAYGLGCQTRSRAAECEPLRAKGGGQEKLNVSRYKLQDKDMEAMGSREDAECEPLLLRAKAVSRCGLRDMAMEAR